MENVANLSNGHPEYVRAVISQIEDLGYTVSQKILCAENFGVSQRRKRLFLVAHHGEFDFECLTESRPPTVLHALGPGAFSGLSADQNPELVLTSNMDTYIERYERKSKCKTPRDLMPGQSARTLTCRNLAGKTSDMIRLKLDDGRRRELTVREAATLSGFPSTFEFPESIMTRSTLMKCIGNAVPPPLAKCLAEALIKLV